MGLALVGVLPVSGINIGIQAGFPAIQAKVVKLNADISNLQASLLAQAAVSANIPSLPGLAAGIQAQIANLPTLLDPTQIIQFSAGAQADIAAQLGLVELQIALVGSIAADFQAGLDTGGLSAWTYAGQSAAFGEQLEVQTRNGYSGVGADDHINAVIVATESFSSWGNFSATFNTGTTSVRELESTTGADLDFLGTLTGGQLNTGVLDLFQPINLYLLELEGLKANLEFALSAALGINLPSLPQMVAALDLDVSLMLDNLINVSVDLDAQISGLLLEIELLIKLTADLGVSIAAGGLALWFYNGPASGLGSEFKTAVEGGIPGGSGPDVPAYGVVVATKLPAAWASFGLIFAVS
jgi:hypothetical protein